MRDKDEMRALWFLVIFLMFGFFFTGAHYVTHLHEYHGFFKDDVVYEEVRGFEPVLINRSFLNEVSQHG